MYSVLPVIRPENLEAINSLAVEINERTVAIDVNRAIIAEMQREIEGYERSIDELTRERLRLIHS